MGLMGRSLGQPTDRRPRGRAWTDAGPISEDAREASRGSLDRSEANELESWSGVSRSGVASERSSFDDTPQPSRELVQAVCGTERGSPGFWTFALVWFALAFAMPTFFVALGLFSGPSDTSAVGQITWGIFLGSFALMGVWQLARSGTESKGNGLRRTGLIVEGTRVIPWRLIGGFIAIPDGKNPELSQLWAVWSPLHEDAHAQAFPVPSAFHRNTTAKVHATATQLNQDLGSQLDTGEMAQVVQLVQRQRMVPRGVYLGCFVMSLIGGGFGTLFALFILALAKMSRWLWLLAWAAFDLSCLMVYMTYNDPTPFGAMWALWVLAFWLGPTFFFLVQTQRSKRAERIGRLEPSDVTQPLQGRVAKPALVAVLALSALVLVGVLVISSGGGTVSPHDSGPVSPESRASALAVLTPANAAFTKFFDAGEDWDSVTTRHSAAAQAQPMVVALQNLSVALKGRKWPWQTSSDIPTLLGDDAALTKVLERLQGPSTQSPRAWFNSSELHEQLDSTLT